MDLCEPVIIGKSTFIQNLRNRIRMVASTDFNVLICGAMGVGKDLVAQALHLTSYRKNRPFIKVNCGEISSELLETELFGCEKEIFPGTGTMRLGKLRQAHGGTILLDQIDAMPLALQVKLLRVLEGYEFTPVNSKRKVRADCWVLAATNGNLEKLIKQRLFREDLYYRLNIIRIMIPPLRERVEDIEPLVHYFAGQFASEIEKPRFRFSGDGIMDTLQHYPWPGNVRELRDTVKLLSTTDDWEAVKKRLAFNDQLFQSGTRAEVWL